MNERFGEYELLEKIAVGGMAELYKARSVHGQGVEKIVVVKRIHPALSADGNFVAMFIDEARLSVSLVHGNIVPVFDFGHFDGHYYLVMEYVEGHDLAVLNGRAKVVHKPWPLDIALHVTSEILRGLEYAHNKKDAKGRSLKLVHRDISPSNILISTEGEVKILDFGIARSLSREFETRTGVVKGKPGYMAPEQAAGQKVDARADIWSVGAVLHEFVTGQKLKDGRTTSGDDEVDAILDKALAAEPDARYRDATEFRFALDDLLHARRLRPSAATVAAWAREVTSASSPNADWTMRSSDAADHMAAALQRKKEETQTTANLRRGTTAPTTHLLEPQPARRFKKLAAVISLLALGGIAALLYWNTQVESTSLSEDTTTSAPAAQSQPAYIQAECDPKGASIELDGRAHPTPCPATIEVSPGTVEIMVTKSGHRPYRTSLTTVAGATSLVRAQLEAIPSALRVTASPKGAQVKVDGVVRGTVPLELGDLPPGPHSVKVTARGHGPEVQTIELVPGQTSELAFALKPSPRTTPIIPKQEPSYLSINSDPWSYVTLDGKPIGSTPKRKYKVRPGKHTVEFENPYSKLSKRLEITVEPGQTKDVIVKLR